MAEEEVKLSKVEGVKEASNYLRGTIEEQFQEDAPNFSQENYDILKFHGTYQQDNRDERGGGGKSYSFMVRSRIPGGKVTAAQFLAELDICERYGNGTLRITDRQGFQIHGVLKGDLKATIRGINESKLSTICACGDVCRNFMCCPAPFKREGIHAEMQATADALANHFRPQTQAYYEIWLSDGETREKVHEVTDEHEPIYGKTYLPRKFKMGIALPHDNCVDVYAQDLGFLAVVENDRIIGYNVLPGGSMGMTPARKDTFPAVAHRLCFVTPDQVVPVAEAIVKVQRDFGNRADRKIARMKYLIANWGLEKFKAKVEEYYGAPLAPPHAADVTDADDHMGWHEQGDGKGFLGINVDNGRIKDEGDFRLKTALRVILGKYPVDTRLTALQGMILCDLTEAMRDDIESILTAHGVELAQNISLTRRYSIACPALPTCGLAVTEAERIMPDVVREFEQELDRQGLTGERVSIHMTGCPNGCARPYTPDIGLVGKARGKYTVYLGGNTEGRRIAFLYQDMVPQEEIVSHLAPVLAQWKRDRVNGEAFGDYCHRVGQAALPQYAGTDASGG
ncbi:MAG: NADPH-dependent assimilatory sulfite reductase hemoprotein subunit [Planctomycetaceae bacterium]